VVAPWQVLGVEAKHVEAAIGEDVVDREQRRAIVCPTGQVGSSPWPVRVAAST
jgi:hypothetical protein